MSLGIYYIGYIRKKPEWNVNGVNHLYLMINRIDGFVEKEDDNKYLNLLIQTEILKCSKSIQKFGIELKIVLNK